MPPIAIFEDIQLPEGSKKDRYPLIISTFTRVMSGYEYQHLDVEGLIMSISGHGRYTIDESQEEAIEIVTFDVKRDATMFMWLTPTIIAIIGTIISIILWVFSPPK